MKRRYLSFLLLLGLCLLQGHTQTPSPLVNLLTNTTDYSTIWAPFYTSNGTGVPGNYFGPAYGSSYTDPIFGDVLNMVPRPTDCPDTCTTDQYGYIGGYSKVTLLSQDKKYYIMMDIRGWLYLYDATSQPFIFIRRIQMGSSSNAFIANGNDLSSDFSNWNWSRSSGTHLIYYVGIGNGAGRDTLKAYNPDTDTSSVIWNGGSVVASYTGCGNLDNAREGESSEDDSTFAWMCTGADQSDQKAFVIYNKTTNTAVSKSTAAGQLCSYTSTGTCPSLGANYITISPDADYLVVNWNAGSSDALWVPGEGTELMDLSFNYIGGVTSNNNHGDVGYDVNGNEIFVQNADGALDTQYHMLAVAKLSACTSKTVIGPVSTGGCQHYFRLPSSYCWCTGETISLRATQGQGRGLLLLSNYDSNTTYNSPNGLYSLENLMLQINWNTLSDDNSSDQVSGSPNPLWRLGKTYSIKAAPSNPSYGGDYYAQPNATPFMDASGFSFTSTYDHCNVAPCAIPNTELPTGYGLYENYYVELPIPGPPAPTIVSITVLPPSASIFIGSTVHYAIGANGSSFCTYSDTSIIYAGQTGCLPSWTDTSTHSSINTSTGIATGISAGTDTITATIGSIFGTASLTVNTIPPYNFLTNVGISGQIN